MGARDRLLGIAGRAILRASGGMPQTKDAATRRAGSAAALTGAGIGYTSNWDVDRAVTDGYEKVIWCFSAIDAIATKASSWPIRVMEGDRPDWVRVEDPLATCLNTKANSIDGPARFLRYRLSSQLILSKAGVFVEVIPTNSGRLAALNLLPAGRTKPVPDADNFIAGFEITLPTGDKQYLPAYTPETGYGVIWIRKPHPTDPYSGVTPLEAAGISLDLDFYARLYNRNFLLNDGRSGQIVAVSGGLSPEDAQELKARFSPGMGGVGRTTVIEADAVHVQDTAISPRDAQYAELRNITKEDLLIALGTPESVIGNASGRTFANADAERENWLEVTVANHVSVIEAGLHQLTLGGWDDNRHVWHDTSGETILNRRQWAREDQATAQFAAGLITADEHRAIAGRELINVPGTRVLYLVAGKAPVGSPADQDAVSALKAISMSRSTTTDSLSGPSAPGAPAATDDPESKALPATQKCHYCKAQAAMRVIHSEGIAYIPACPDHLKKAKDDAARCTPDGSRDPSNVVAVRPIPAAKSAAIADYINGVTFAEVDAYLRGHTESKTLDVDLCATTVVDLDGAIASTVAVEPGVVFRGLDASAVDGMTVGATFTDVAYSLASADDTSSLDWGAAGVLALNFSVGQRMMMVDEAKEEVLLPRNLTFTVESIEDREGVRVVSASVVA